MKKVIYIVGTTVKEVELESFSKQGVLQYAEVPESQLICNDPEDEDNTWDLTVQHGSVYTTVTLFDTDGDPFFYMGLTKDWEGTKEIHD